MILLTTLSIKYLRQNRLSEIVRECTPTRAVWKKTMSPEMGDRF